MCKNIEKDEWVIILCGVERDSDLHLRSAVFFEKLGYVVALEQDCQNAPCATCSNCRSHAKRFGFAKTQSFSFGDYEMAAMAAGWEPDEVLRFAEYGIRGALSPEEAVARWMINRTVPEKQ